MSGSDTSAEVLVLGAGIVGVCVALHLQARGRDVVIVDRREPGSETSHGNAGLIEMSTAFPHPCPQHLPTLLRYALNQSPDVRYHSGHLPRIGGKLFSYWSHSRPGRIERLGQAFRRLIAQALHEHEAFIREGGLDAFVRRGGWIELIESRSALDAAPARIDAMGEYDITAEMLDAEQLAAAEPSLLARFAGAVRWGDTVAINDPGGYVKELARLFLGKGGRIERISVERLEKTPSGWGVSGVGQGLRAVEAVVALGPWSPDILAPLGYRVPMMSKRGYHMHYALRDGAVLNHPIHLPGSGYLLLPMREGVRLTTGVELADRDAPPSPVQLDRAEKEARKLFPLGERLNDQAWLGTRPCMPDMLPLIGPAPKHKNLWFAFGHGHHGFTLGPPTGRLLAEMMTETTPFVDAEAYSPARYV
jgi:D-amino-acid dehydrogenase